MTKVWMFRKEFDRMIKGETIYVVMSANKKQLEFYETPDNKLTEVEVYEKNETAAKIQELERENKQLQALVHMHDGNI